jgi:hypothetical protein
MFPRFSACERENSKPGKNPVNSSWFFAPLPLAGVNGTGNDMPGYQPVSHYGLQAVVPLQ